MIVRRFACVGVVAIVLAAATANEASAQVFVTPAPVVSYFVPAQPVPVAFAPVAPAVAFQPVPAVSYYYAPVVPAVAAPVVVPAPTTSFYVPARVSRGLFGRTIIRTPFSKTKF